MTSLPASVREAIEDAASDFADGTPIRTAEPVAGGCINNGARLTFASGAEAFAKWNPDAPAGMFEAEADGLAALRSALSRTGHLQVPAPITLGSAGDARWLLLEWIPPAPETTETEEVLGRGLALMHDFHSSGGTSAPPVPGDFGWPTDNWIGALPQSNRQDPDWSHFWSSERIRPQLRHARTRGFCGDASFDRLLDGVPAAFADVDLHPALVHGDLWRGNVMTTTSGVPALIDPAAYLGHGEVDLAMTELFGGFGRRFYDAYHEVRPISEAYHSHLRELYQLYYLLVHVNLFGGAYEARARHAAERVIAELRLA